MIEELEKEEKRVSGEIEELTRRRNQLRQKIAEGLCPFNVGDKVINNRGVNAVVSSIGWGWRNYEFKVRKLKKNGDPYKDSTRTNNWEGWKLTE